MLHRVQALALFALMAFATALQGASVMQCLCSGRVVFTGFGQTACAPPRETEKPHCPRCAREQAPAPDHALCEAGCWRMIDFGEGQTPQPSAVLEIPAQAPAEIQDFAPELVHPRPFARRETVVHRPPDPPGPPLTILYASLLL